MSRPPRPNAKQRRRARVQTFKAEEGGWWRDTPESRRLVAIERHRLDVAEATYGLDKRQRRRVRRRMGRVTPPAKGNE